MPPSKYWTIRRILKYGSPLVRPFEARLIKKYSGREHHQDPVFIIGLPRSGSTYIYQLITDAFDVLYIDNLMMLGRETLYFSGWLSHLLYKESPHHSYESSFGDTWQSGLHGPSEAGALWYRWIPKELILAGEDDVDDKKGRGLRANMLALTGRYKKPLVIKNLYFSNRIRLVHSLFPDARFIWVQRDPLYVAQSIYISRLENTKDPVREWWSVKFPGYESVLGKQLEVQVARQVIEIQNIIEKDLSLIDPRKVLKLNYEQMDREFLEGPLREFMETGYRTGIDPAALPFRAGNKQKLDNVIFDRLQQELERCSAESQNKNR
jgi:hypothetical protein